MRPTIGHELSRTGLLTPEGLKRASDWRRANGGSIERALVASGAVEEEALTASRARLSGLEAAHRDRLVEADPSRLRRIVEGLLANAFVHGHGSPVSLRASRDESGVEVVDADGGPGIPAERLALVFVPFSAPDGKGGLGLTLVRSLSQQLKGTLVMGRGPDLKGASIGLAIASVTEREG